MMILSLPLTTTPLAWLSQILGEFQINDFKEEASKYSALSEVLDIPGYWASNAFASLDSGKTIVAVSAISRRGRNSGF